MAVTLSGKSGCVVGRIPTQQPPLQEARHHVSRFAEQGIKTNSQEHNIGLQKVPGSLS